MGPARSITLPRRALAGRAVSSNHTTRLPTDHVALIRRPTMHQPHWPDHHTTPPHLASLDLDLPWGLGKKAALQWISWTPCPIAPRCTLAPCAAPRLATSCDAPSPDARSSLCHIAALLLAAPLRALAPSRRPNQFLPHKFWIFFI